MSAVKNNSTEENKMLFSGIIEAFNNGNHDAPFEVMASDCVIQDERGVTFDKESYRKRIAELLAVFPDYHLVIEDLYAIEDKVIVRYSETGTMEGDFMGIPATGKSFIAPAIEIWRFNNGKLTGLWMARDTLTASIQTGMINM